MKINEVLDSTQSWANLKGVSLEKYSDLETAYRQQLEIIKTVHGITSSLTPAQNTAVIENLKKQMGDFISTSNEYIRDLTNLGITDDLDLTAKITNVDSMKTHIAHLNSKF